MSARGQTVGFELLTIDRSQVYGLQNIPDEATALRVFFNATGTTGANVVSLMCVKGVSPDNYTGVQFTDGGGYIEFYSRHDVVNFRAIALDDNSYDLQVFYTIFPWK